MARMIPPRLPDPAGEDPISPAERLLFKEFARQLGPDYTVLHAVRWLARDGEADFLLAHPRLGVLVLGVKGGAIERDGATLAWTSRDRHGAEHPIKDPFAQALHGLYALRDNLRDAPATAGFGYPLARAVAFPDVLVGEGDLGPDAPRAIVLDSADLPTLVRGLRRAWSPPVVRADPPGEAGVAALVAALKPPLALARTGLAAAIRSEEGVLLALTERQYALLDALGEHRRIAVAREASYRCRPRQLRGRLSCSPTSVPPSTRRAKP